MSEPSLRSSPDSAAAPRPSWREVVRLYRFLGASREKLVGAAVCVQLANLGQLVFAGVAGSLVDGTLRLRMPPGNLWARWVSLENIDTLGLVLFGLLCVVVVLRYLETSWFHEVAERALTELRVRVFSRLMFLPMSWYSKRRVGDLSSRLLGDMGQLQDHWALDLRHLMGNGVMIAGSLALMALTSWELTLWIFALAPVAAGAGLVLGRLIRNDAQTTQDRLGQSAVIVEESLQAVQSVKTCVTENWEVERYRESLESGLEPAIRGGRRRSLFISIIFFLAFGSWVFLMWKGSKLIHAGHLSPGAFTGYMFFVAYAGTAAGALAEVFGRWNKAMGAMGRLAEILAGTPERPGGLPEGASALLPDRLQGQVEFEGVSFSYPARPEARVLYGLSLRVAAGERIALVGPSGAGKSTIAALVCRLFEPTAGRLLIDGRHATQYPLRWLRGQMAFVPQEVLLFGGTIAENIAYGAPQATRSQIVEAAAKARAKEFIKALPAGFETRVGDRGSRLSGGQRQRIALARAILRDPAILILDEATSALDAENERLVQEALEEVMAGRTTIIIAHRLSTVRKADRILVIQDGDVVEEGTHAALYARGGAYRQLCDHQLEPADSALLEPDAEEK